MLELCLARRIPSKLCLNMRFCHKYEARMMHACMRGEFHACIVHLRVATVLGFVIWLASLYVRVKLS